MDENTNVSETAQVATSFREAQNEVLPTPPKPVSQEAPKVVREAEHKLKEMSRKAKERKTAHNASKNAKGLSEINYFWLVIGGLGALGVGYLVFWKKEPDPRPRQRFKFVPKPKTPEKRREGPKEPIVEKKEKPVPKFELNCF